MWEQLLAKQQQTVQYTSGALPYLLTLRSFSCLVVLGSVVDCSVPSSPLPWRHEIAIHASIRPTPFQLPRALAVLIPLPSQAMSVYFPTPVFRTRCLPTPLQECTVGPLWGVEPPD